MNREYESLSPLCPVCDSECYLTTELIEYIIGKQIEMNTEDLADIDALVKESIEGNHNHQAHFEEPKAFFPIALDLRNNGLTFIAWCPICKAPRIMGITVREIQELLREAKE